MKGPWPRPDARGTRNLVLFVCVLFAGALGLTVAQGWWGSDTIRLDALRDSLQVATGALFFGAGLLHRAVLRVDHDTARGRAGLALIVCGFLAPWITGFGHVLHRDPTAAELSPLTSAFVAVLVLGLGAVTLTRPATEGSHTRLGSTLVVVLLLGLLAAPVVAHPLLPVALDLTPVSHLALELSVAALWIIAAVATEARRRRTGTEVAGIGFGVLCTMGVVWLFRALAVVDVQPWSLAASILLAAIGVVVLSTAALDFTASAEAGQRADAAEEALHTVSAAFTALDDHRRDVTHDARNVILAMRAATQTLVNHGEEITPEARQQLRLALAQEIDHLYRLIDRPSGDGDAVSAFDIAQVIGNVVELERIDGLDVTAVLPRCAALGRPEDLARVVHNLLANARRHAPGSPVTIHGWVSGGRLRVLVEDEGPGIPRAMRRTLFGRAVTQEGSPGSGVGLHVSRALMHQQGGSLELVEQPGPGAVFALTLPVDDDVPEQRRTGISGLISA